MLKRICVLISVLCLIGCSFANAETIDFSNNQMCYAKYKGEALYSCLECQSFERNIQQIYNNIWFLNLAEFIQEIAESKDNYTDEQKALTDDAIQLRGAWLKYFNASNTDDFEEIWKDFWLGNLLIKSDIYGCKTTGESFSYLLTKTENFLQRASPSATENLRTMRRGFR